MMLVISPAKRMDVVEGPPVAATSPEFLADAQHLAYELRSLGYEGARAVWSCSDALARPNWERLSTLPEDMASDPRLLSSAVLTYVGIQYQHLAPQVMTERELTWLSSHLRILSGMYGTLRPLDGVVPYRLEMQARLAVGGHRDLYGFWGETSRCPCPLRCHAPGKRCLAGVRQGRGPLGKKGRHADCHLRLWGTSHIGRKVCPTCNRGEGRSRCLCALVRRAGR